MIHEIFDKHDNFRGPAAYILRSDRGYRLDSTAGPEAGIDEVVEDFNSYRALNKRVQRPVFHCAINLAPGESLSDDQWRSVTKTYLKALGFEDCAYVIAKHTNRAHEHIHIVASRIDASGRCVSDSNDYAKGERVMRTMEQQLGLSRVAPSRESPKRDFSGDEIQAALSSNTPNLRFELQQEISHAAESCSSLRLLVERLSARGISVHFHSSGDGTPAGISYEVDGCHFDGGSLGRAFTLNGLQRLKGLALTAQDQSWIADLLPKIHLSPSSHAASSVVKNTINECLRQGDSNLTIFVERLAAQGIEVSFHLAPTGQPRGISFHYQDLSWTGSQLGRSFTLGGLARRGARYDAVQDAGLVERRSAGRDERSLSTWKGLQEPTEGSPDLSTSWKGWSLRAARELETRLLRIRPPKSARREISSALFELRRVPQQAIRAAAHALYLFATLTSPKRAARLLISRLPGGRHIDEALAFVGAFRSPGAAVMFALRLARSSRQRPSPEPLARTLVHAYASAALIDSPAGLVERLSEAGISLSRRAGKLVLGLADQTIPAYQLGALGRRLGDAYDTHLATRPRPDLDTPQRPFLSPRTDGAPKPANRNALGPLLSRPEPLDPTPRNAPPPPRPGQRFSGAAAPHSELEPMAERLARPYPAPSRPNLPPAGLVPSSGGAKAPADWRELRGLVPGSVSARPETASGPPATEVFSTAVELQLRALPGPFDLRIVAKGQRSRTISQLQADEIRAMLPTLSSLHQDGYGLLLRSRSAQLLTNIPRAAVESAIERGLVPATVVQKYSGLCDVWITHPTPVMTPYLSRAVALEFGAPVGPPPARFGRLATRPEMILAHEGAVSPRLAEIHRLLTPHVAASHENLHAACRLAGIPTLREFRSTQRLAPREADRRWSHIALKAGLSPDQAFSALFIDGARRNAPRPQAAARYAARLLQDGLQTVRGLAGQALAASTLQAVSGGLAIPIQILRLAGFVIKVTAGRRRD